MWEARKAAGSNSQTVRVFGKNRTPCEDSHYEAFILRSSWSVGNLYAANLQLGQSYAKQVQGMEKQRRTWLSRREKEQEVMKKRLETLQKNCQKLNLERSYINRVEDRKQRQRSATVVGIVPRGKNFTGFDTSERFPKMKLRSISQPAVNNNILRHGPNRTENSKRNQGSDRGFGEGETMLFSSHPRNLPRVQSEPSVSNLQPAGNVFSSTFKPDQTLRRTYSFIPSSVKFSQYYSVRNEGPLAVDKQLLPKWIPMNMRLRKNREKNWF